MKTKQITTNHLPISKQAARGLGLRSLTKPYNDNESAMLENVLKDMRSGGIRHAKVSTNDGIEVWRG